MRHCVVLLIDGLIPMLCGDINPVRFNEALERRNALEAAFKGHAGFYSIYVWEDYLEAMKK